MSTSLTTIRNYVKLKIADKFNTSEGDGYNKLLVSLLKEAYYKIILNYCDNLQKDTNKPDNVRIAAANTFNYITQISNLPRTLNAKTKEDYLNILQLEDPSGYKPFLLTVYNFSLIDSSLSSETKATISNLLKGFVDNFDYFNTFMVTLAKLLNKLPDQPVSNNNSPPSTTPQTTPSAVINTSIKEEYDMYGLIVSGVNSLKDLGVDKFKDLQKFIKVSADKQAQSQKSENESLINWRKQAFTFDILVPLTKLSNDLEEYEAILKLRQKAFTSDISIPKEIKKVQQLKAQVKKAIVLQKSKEVDTKKSSPNLSPSNKQISKVKGNPPVITSSKDNSSTLVLPSVPLPESRTPIALTPEQWGIKFTTSNTPNPALVGPSLPTSNFYMDLLPARQSTIPVQGGRDVPNAMPGLNYKLVTQVGKQAIPGFSPVYQNLGIKGMQVTIVGAFTGGDGSKQLADAPEPNSKTPFWSNAKGSPSLSDNPGRGGKLPELTAYNSSAEFKQVIYQGKQIEVEINLFQVYNQSTASQIGQDIKLQSKNGNPKFTGIVRSFDEYHATKERTWYTLIMDVTDFGMASKEHINLNNKLEEAIRNAQAQLEAAQQLEAKENAEQEAATIPNDPESTQVISNIRQRILALKDPTQKKKQLAIYDHLLEHIKTLKNKDNYAFKTYNGSQPWGTFIYNIGTYSDSSFFPISNSQLLFRLRLDCRTLLGIQGTCDSELYWLLDGAEGNTKPITKFIGNGTRQSTFLMLANEKKERIAKDPFGFGPYPEENGSESQRNSLLSQAKNLSNAERGSLTIKAIGCVAIGALGTVASVGTAGLATPGAIATTLGACALFTSAEAYEKYDTLNKNEAQWSNAVWGELAMDLLLTLGTVGLVRGGGAILSKVTKQGTTVASNQISSFISNLKTKAKANIGKTIKYGNQTAIIEAVDGVPLINSKTAVRLRVGTETYQVPIEDIANELDNIVPSTVTTATTSTSANPPTATSSGAAGSFVYIPGQQIPVSGNTSLAKQILQNLKGTNAAGVNSPGLKFKRVGGGTLNVESIIGVTDDAVYIKTSLTDQTSTKIPLSSITDIIYPTEVKVIKVPVSTNSSSQSSKPPVKPQPIAPTSLADNLINAFDSSIINTQAKANLIANADVSYKQTVIELLNAKQTGTLNQYELYYAGNGTTRPITNITVSETNVNFSYSSSGVDSYNFTQDISGRVRKVQAKPNTPQPPSNPVIPQQQTTTQTTQTQQPNTGGSGQSSVVQPPTQVNWVDDFNKNPQSFNSKATSVTELEATVEQRRLGASVSPIMQSSSKGNFWVIEQSSGVYSLSYKPNIKLNEFNYDSFISYFDAPSTLPTGKSPYLVAPAELIKTGDRWTVVKKGKVIFN